MDDFLIILTKDASLNVAEAAHDVLSLFRQHGKGLDFTCELPVDHFLQFLDLKIEFWKDHVCWAYAP